jgi:hypothetical protein
MAGLVPRGEQTTAMARGHYLEPAVAAWFRDQHPDWIVRPSGTWAAADNPRRTASPDRLITKPDVDGFDLLQIKSTTKGREWGAPGSDRIPPDYYDQVQWEMDVVGASRCHVAIIGAFLDFAEYVVDYNPARVAQLRAEGCRFLALLDAGTPPSIDTHGATYYTVRQLHTDVDDTATVTLDTATARAFVAAKAAADQADAAYKATKTAVLDAMGDASTARWGDITLATRRATKNGASLYPAKTLPDLGVFDALPDEPEFHDNNAEQDVPPAAPVVDPVTSDEPVKVGDLLPTLEASLRARGVDPAHPDGGDQLAGRADEARDRLKALRSDPDAVATVKTLWPAVIAPKPPWTHDELDAIERVLHAADGKESTWLGLPDPELVAKVETARERLAPVAEPAPSPDDKVAPAERTALMAAIKAMGADARDRAAGWHAEGKANGQPWGSSAAGRMTLRTYWLTRASAACAAHLIDDDLAPDDLTRACLALVLGEDVAPAVPTGAAIGALTIDEAQRLEALATAYAQGDETVAADIGAAVVRVA